MEQTNFDFVKQDAEADMDKYMDLQRQIIRLYFATDRETKKFIAGCLSALAREYENDLRNRKVCEE